MLTEFYLHTRTMETSKAITERFRFLHDRLRHINVELRKHSNTEIAQRLLQCFCTLVLPYYVACTDPKAFARDQHEFLMLLKELHINHRSACG